MTHRPTKEYDDAEAHRRNSCLKVQRRSRGICEFCMRAQAQDFHEVRQRNNHIRTLRVEEGIYSEQNIMHLCRNCHSRSGQTTWGKMAMLWILHTRYGYELPEDFHARCDTP